ncbi:hypothetical protein [Aminobacter aminovorans]|uniref:hypothetical protein n=1 Tax=Aminobacter aminovorans TaxID=83263 RepID=UPI00285FE031|nr:hypothetical protein [Aminobacter aminovorans]MDR7219865.1 hypothetical protein [Aminobacter aminovorans]
MTKLNTITDEITKLENFHRIKRAELEQQLQIEEDKARAIAETEAQTARDSRRREAAQHAKHLLKVSAEADKTMAKLAELLQARREAARACRAIDPEAGRSFGHAAEYNRSVNGAMNHHGCGIYMDVKRERGGETLLDQDQRHFKILADFA